MSERHDFEIRIEGRDYLLKLGNCAVKLFVNKPEIDYLWVDEQGENPSARVFLNHDLVRWMAGMAIRQLEDDPDDIEYVNTYFDDGGEGFTFRAVYGWNARRVIDDDPSEEEIAAYEEAVLSINTPREEWK